jgi:hypothetical protein
MKRNKLLSVTCMAVVAVVLMGTIAYTASLNKEIKATLSQDIKIRNGGVVQVLKNSAGQTLYPIIYNGTTYLPVASVGNMLDVPVRWEGSTRTVVLGTEKQQPKSVLKFAAKTSNYSSKVTDKGSLTLPGELGSDTSFNDGIYFDVWNGASSASIDRAYKANINGLYSKLSFDAYATTKDEKNNKAFKVCIYNVDTNETIGIIQVEAGIVKHIEDIDITGVKNIGFAANCATAGGYGNAYFFNPIVE